jgi:hypothetical protein
MLNQQNHEPIAAAEYFSLMRLLQHLENQGPIPGAEETDWQAIYAKLNASCLRTRNAERSPQDDAESIPGIRFAVSNDGGKTGVAWRRNVHQALDYLDKQNASGGDYAVVAVRSQQVPSGGAA